jgi:hypothetical protein
MSWEQLNKTLQQYKPEHIAVLRIMVNMYQSGSDSWRVFATKYCLKQGDKLMPFRDFTDTCHNVVVNPRLSYCNGCWQVRKDSKKITLSDKAGERLEVKKHDAFKKKMTSFRCF